ncbi:MAG: protein kinase [Deltaproteobacteria bacterium]|nr:protein kinase [Deltaproteobacteria bacterium]
MTFTCTCGTKVSLSPAATGAPWSFDPPVCPNPKCGRVVPESWEGPAIPHEGKPAYTIGPFIAAGGFGAVFQAVQHSANRQVAVKVLHWSETAAVEEAVAMGAVRHPDCVVVHDAGVLEFTNAGRPGFIRWLAMEFLPGTRTLAQVLADDPGSLTAELRLELASRIADVLARIHVCRWVHRDVTPSNVFLSGGTAGPLDVKVGDLGLAAPIGTRPSVLGATEVAGTTPIEFYAPEEQYDDVHRYPADPAWDAYALGQVLRHDLVPGCPALAGVQPLERLVDELRRMVVSVDEARERLEGIRASLFPGWMRMRGSKTLSLFVPSARYWPDDRGSGQVAVRELPVASRIRRPADPPEIVLAKVELNSAVPRSECGWLSKAHGAGPTGELLGELDLDVYMWSGQGRKDTVPWRVPVRVRLSPAREQDRIVLGRDFLEHVGVARVAGVWAVFPTPDRRDALLATPCPSPFDEAFEQAPTQPEPAVPATH